MASTKEQVKQNYISFVTNLKRLEPKATQIYCHFLGSGDSFDSFDIIELRDKDSNELRIPTEIDIENNLSEIWWQVIETLGCSFNDDGSQGTIIIDLTTGIVSADFEWWEMTTVPGDSLEEKLSDLFPDEEIEKQQET